MRRILDDREKDALIARYCGNWTVPHLGYGTVHDYCDSVDHLPQISSIQGDMKDMQRPFAVKAILARVSPGSSLMEIGAGEPIVAGILSELGYPLVVVDPYDGSGGGPRNYRRFVKEYPHIRIVRAQFDRNTLDLLPGSFDCIFSVSVLEHINEPNLSKLFSGIRRFLRPGGDSIHIVDHVLHGKGAEAHTMHLMNILRNQAMLAGGEVSGVQEDLTSPLAHLEEDLETYYLSAAGHNLWRGNLSYEQFPFRKCVSIHTIVQSKAMH